MTGVTTYDYRTTRTGYGKGRGVDGMDCPFRKKEGDDENGLGVLRSCKCEQESNAADQNNHER